MNIKIHTFNLWYTVSINGEKRNTKGFIKLDWDLDQEISGDKKSTHFLSLALSHSHTHTTQISTCLSDLWIIHLSTKSHMVVIKNLDGSGEVYGYSHIIWGIPLKLQ